MPGEFVAVERHACFEAEGVAGSQAGRDKPVAFAGFKECFPQRGSVRVRDVDLEPVFARVAGAGQQQVLSADGHLNSRVVLELRDQGVLLRRDEPQHDGFRIRTLDSDQGGPCGGVLDNNVETRRTLLQLRCNNCSVARIRHHEELLRTPTVRDEVVDDAAVGVADQRVLGFAVGDRGQLAHQGVVQEGGCFRAGHPDFAHVGEVEQAGRLAHRVVLSQLGVVLEGHLPAAEVREGRAGLFVLLIESGVVLRHHGSFSSQTLLCFPRTLRGAGRSRPGYGRLQHRQSGRPAGSTCPA